MLSSNKASTLTPERATIGAMSIGARIKARREQLKLTQAQLAEQVGVTRSAVTQLEGSTTHDPKPKNLLRYAKALRLSVEELVHGHAPTKAEQEPAHYATLTPAERVLIDYIRASCRDDDQRESLARIALSLLLALAARPVPDARLTPEWDARNRKERK
jgi:transcriptional regulator with XRE-family HTH domain